MSDPTNADSVLANLSLHNGEEPSIKFINEGRSLERVLCEKP